MFDASKFGKGFVPDPPDPRDYRLELLGAAPPVDWNTPFSVPEPIDHNQGTSDACVAYASSYYHETLRPTKAFSRRDLFARIAQSYGAYLRDGAVAIAKEGQATKDECFDPYDPTPTNMRDKVGVEPAKQLDDREEDAFAFNADIETMARTIRDFKGCVFGFFMTDKGFADPINPRPPASGEPQLGHAVYGIGFHMHNGLRCIIAKSSFGNVNGTVDGSHHHIKENYFNSGNIFNNCWTIVPRKDSMSNAIFVHKAGTQEYGFYLPALNQDSIKDKALNLGAAVTKPDGTIDFSKAKEVTGL